MFFYPSRGDIFVYVQGMDGFGPRGLSKPGVAVHESSSIPPSRYSTPAIRKTAITRDDDERPSSGRQLLRFRTLYHI
jgi:hypothetical protein